MTAVSVQMEDDSGDTDNYGAGRSAVQGHSAVPRSIEVRPRGTSMSQEPVASYIANNNRHLLPLVARSWRVVVQEPDGLNMEVNHRKGGIRGNGTRLGTLVLAAFWL